MSILLQKHLYQIAQKFDSIKNDHRPTGSASQLAPHKQVPTTDPEAKLVSCSDKTSFVNCFLKLLKEHSRMIAIRYRMRDHHIYRHQNLFP